MVPALLRTTVFCALLAGPAVLWTEAGAQELLTVSGVDVDVTGDSAADARSAAFSVGQRKAFDKLLGQLVDPASAAALAPLSDDQISAMVADFEIESEQTSSVRYIGVLTYRFYADPVRQYLSGTGARFTATRSPPVLVVPVLTQDESSILWDEGNPWLAAWAQHGGGGLVPVRVPIGDIEDIAAVDAERALGGDLAALDALARRYGAADTLVAEARINPAGVDTAQPASGPRRSPAASGRPRRNSAADWRRPPARCNARMSTAPSPQATRMPSAPAARIVPGDASCPPSRGITSHNTRRSPPR